MVKRRETGFLEADSLLGSAAKPTARDPQVLIVGTASRTWRIDYAEFWELLLYLDHHHAKVSVLDEGPFIYMAVTVALEYDFRIWPCDIDSLDVADLVVAFIARDAKDIAEHEAVASALLNGTPVLAIYSDGTTLFVTEHNYVRQG